MQKRTRQLISSAQALSEVLGLGIYVPMLLPQVVVVLKVEVNLTLHVLESLFHFRSNGC